VLLAVPALRAWRRAGQPLVLAAQPRIGALLAALRVVDEYVAFDALGLQALFVDAPASEPRLPPAARVVSWFGAREPVFVRRLRERVPDAVVAPSTGEGLVWEHLLATVGAPDGDWRAPLVVPPALRDAGRAALAAAGWDGRPFVLVHAGAGGRAKRWPADGFAAALATLGAGYDVVVHRGPADADAVEALVSRLGRRPRLLDHPALDALAGAVTHAASWLGNDSGVSHLAAAVGAPCVVLFHPANLAWRPWAGGAAVVTVAPDTVRPADVAAVAAALAGRV